MFVGVINSVFYCIQNILFNFNLFYIYSVIHRNMSGMYFSSCLRLPDPISWLIHLNLKLSEDFVLHSRKKHSVLCITHWSSLLKCSCLPFDYQSCLFLYSSGFICYIPVIYGSLSHLYFYTVNLCRFPVFYLPWSLRISFNIVLGHCYKWHGFFL